MPVLFPLLATGPDTRTPAERHGDAFVDLLDLASRSTHLPREAGERAHVTVTIDFEALKSGLGGGRSRWSTTCPGSTRPPSSIRNGDRCAPC
jgi:hypothetical protein